MPTTAEERWRKAGKEMKAKNYSVKPLHNSQQNRRPAEKWRRKMENGVIEMYRKAASGYGTTAVQL